MLFKCWARNIVGNDTSHDLIFSAMFPSKTSIAAWSQICRDGRAPAPGIILFGRPLNKESG